MSRTWILQANPKRYAIVEALEARPVIYWRIPQYAGLVKTGDRVLIWRAGKEAGLVGWGVVCADPQPYDLSVDPDPFIKGGPWLTGVETYAPVRVWPAAHLAKETVSAAIPGHRIITAPMGTVFPLGGDDLAALKPIMDVNGYDLARTPEEGFVPVPVVSAQEKGEQAEETAPSATPATNAKITPALFLLSTTPGQPTEITIEGDALKLLLVERDALKSLDGAWDAVGVYLLLGTAQTDDAALSAYVGKAQAIRSRVKGGHGDKEWERCLLIERAGLYPFNASDISWLERRLFDVLVEAPQVDLTNKVPPPPEVVPAYKAEILERTVVAALGVLGVLGAFLA